jgi:hypothetical protein
MTGQKPEFAPVTRAIEAAPEDMVVTQLSKIRDRQVAENIGSMHGSALKLFVGAAENIRDSFRAARQGDIQGACALAGAAAGAFVLARRDAFRLTAGGGALTSMEETIMFLVCRDFFSAESHLKDLARWVSGLNSLEDMLDPLLNHICISPER